MRRGLKLPVPHSQMLSSQKGQPTIRLHMDLVTAQLTKAGRERRHTRQPLPLAPPANVSVISNTRRWLDTDHKSSRHDGDR
jgi:hypothetical protein